MLLQTQFVAAAEGEVAVDVRSVATFSPMARSYFVGAMLLYFSAWREYTPKENCTIK